MGALGLSNGDIVEIRSDRAAILAVVEADPSLRRGMVSMSHAFGDGPDRDDEVRAIGANTGRLMSTDNSWDRYTGMPHMSNVPVSVRSHEPA